MLRVEGSGPSVQDLGSRIRVEVSRFRVEDKGLGV